MFLHSKREITRKVIMARVAGPHVHGEGLHGVLWSVPVGTTFFGVAGRCKFSSTRVTYCWNPLLLKKDKDAETNELESCAQEGSLSTWEDREKKEKNKLTLVLHHLPKHPAILLLLLEMMATLVMVNADGLVPDRFTRETHKRSLHTTLGRRTPV